MNRPCTKRFGLQDWASGQESALDILIVEDHELTRKALLALARKMKLAHVGARNYEEAVQAINDKPPQVLLTDWDLGEDTNGIDVANYVLSRNRNCQVIFCTGNCIEALKPQVRHLGSCTFMHKPLSMKDIKLALTDALSAY